MFYIKLQCYHARRVREMILNARRIFHVGIGEEHWASGHSMHSRFLRLWDSYLCVQLMNPGGLSTLYCGREKGLICQEVDLWKRFFSLIYIYIIKASLTERGLWYWMRSQLKCKFLWIWSLCLLQPVAWKKKNTDPNCPNRSALLRGVGWGGGKNFFLKFLPVFNHFICKVQTSV